MQGVVHLCTCLYLPAYVCLCLASKRMSFYVCVVYPGKKCQFQCFIWRRLSVKEQKLQWDWQHSLFHSHMHRTHLQRAFPFSPHPSLIFSLFLFFSAPASSCHLSYFGPHGYCPLFLPSFEPILPVFTHPPCYLYDCILFIAEIINMLSEAKQPEAVDPCWWYRTMKAFFFFSKYTALASVSVRIFFLNYTCIGKETFNLQSSM